ncbi:DUF2917 domain-containing protein [Uliginosibacterium sp. 31-16]|uniref:DUF2917 domain-containing protein n=1 Tax=Uliginosibacterium sp. 31-16 TaxID=3068315 RepID=UPI00273DB7B9|nr:DUF2917 domain-containing protein [Uliginosibacterium sp. 31-16]MDP5239848.1 DUF2917 domain-containing protein [Uliginosibacterium sp. 31-16]
MQDKLVNQTLNIAPGRLCVLTARPGQSLHVLTGRVWLTEAGRPVDIILEAGESHMLRSTGKLLIEAATSAHLHWRSTDPVAVPYANLALAE